MSGVYKLRKYELEIVDELGTGTYGIVYRGVNVDDRTPVAAKKIKYKEKGGHAIEDMSEMALKEVEILTKLKGHPNLVNIIDFFSEGDHHWLIMELCELGDLTKFMKSHTVHLNGKVKVMLDTARGLEFMHSHKPPIVHRDIKPGNVLMKMEGNIIVAKLGDFGMGKLYKVDTNQLTMTTLGGTASFWAPELFVDKKSLCYKPSVDTFALGLLFSVVLLHDRTSKEDSMTPMSVYVRRSEQHLYFGLEMANAVKLKEPMPVLFDPIEYNPMIADIKELIRQMIKYHDKDRASLLYVKCGILEINNTLTEEQFLAKTSECENINQAKGDLESEVERIGGVTSRLKSKNTQLVEVNTGKQHEIGRVESKNTQLLEVNTGLQHEIGRVERKNKVLQSEVSALRPENQRLQQEVTRLREELEMLRKQKATDHTRPKMVKGDVGSQAARASQENLQQQQQQQQTSRLQEGKILTQGEAASTLSYAGLLSGSYEQLQCISNSKCLLKIALINNEIWGCAYDAIIIFNLEGEQVRKVRLPEVTRYIGLAECPTGVVVAGRQNSGLHLIDRAGQYLCQVGAGSYADVSVFAGRVYGLEYSKAKVVVFEYVRSEWRQVVDFGLAYDHAGYNDMICAHSGGVLVSSYNNHCLYLHSDSGALIQQAGEAGSGQPGKLRAPCLCGVDGSGTALVAGRFLSRLQLFTAPSTWQVVTGLPRGVMEPRSVLVENRAGDTYIWVATGDKKLYKFKINN